MLYYSRTDCTFISCFLFCNPVVLSIQDCISLYTYLFLPSEYAESQGLEASCSGSLCTQEGGWGTSVEIMGGWCVGCSGEARIKAKQLPHQCLGADGWQWRWKEVDCFLSQSSRQSITKAHRFHLITALLILYLKASLSYPLITMTTICSPVNIMFAPSSNSCAEVLTPNVMGFADGAFRR